MTSPKDEYDSTFPIIDSHIHLYAESHLSSLNWTGDLPKDHPLNRQNSVQEYKAVSGKQSNLRGFVFLETDRKSGLDSNSWKDALDEVDFLVRIATGSPKEGEGHVETDQKLVLGVVPWAPIPAGTTLLADYIGKVETKFKKGEILHLLKGFRYLVQDKPKGVMLKPEFIQGLQYVGNKDLTFDLGVDARSGGIHQLEEACEMLKLLSASGSKVKIIINHFCKPNLRVTVSEAQAGHPDFIGWKENIKSMASYDSTYMKLSGWFSELPPQDNDQPEDISQILERTKPWLDVVFEAFGPSRILFGSDWPVCGVGGPGAHSWQHWHDLVQATLRSQLLTTPEQRQIWSGTAIEAYNIQV